MSVTADRQQDVDIDLAGLFRALWTRRGRILLVTVCCGALAWGAANLIAPDYRAETRLLIESREPEFTGTNNQVGQAGAGAFDESAISSQVQVLRSIDLIKQVARNMKLHEIEEFDPTANPSAVSDLMVMFGLEKNPLDLAPEERVLKEFQEKLEVYQVERSRVIAIQFTSKDPVLAAAIPNEMAKVYLSLQSGAKLDSNSEASRWLEPEIANLREKVREAEASVASYRSRSDLLLTGETATFASQQLNDISAELARVRGERANAEARAEGVRTALANGRAADTLGDVVGSQMIQRLKERESGIQGEISDLSTTLLDGHPRLKALKSQLEGIRAQIRSETLKILASLENEVSVSQLRERQLVQQLNSLKAASAKAGEDEVGLRALEREAAAQRELLETYLARYREATSRSGENATPADGRIISTAVEPTEIFFPKVLPVTVVAALAGFLASAVWIMLAELFSGRALKPTGRRDIRDEEAVIADPVATTRRSVAPSASVVADRVDTKEPQRDEIDHRYSDAGIEDDEDGEAFEEDEFSIESVAAHIAANDVRIAIAVSPGGDDGSTSTVMLARHLAELGARVVLIDLTGSGCPTRLMAHAQDLPGITDLLSGDVAFGETIHDDRLSDAHIIPRGNAEGGRAMRAIERLQMITHALSNAYDTVIVECGPARGRSVARFARPDACEIILSAPALADDDIIDLVTEFSDAGYSQILLMTGSSQTPVRQNSATASSAA